MPMSSDQRRSAVSAFDKADVLVGFSCKIAVTLQPCDIGYGFQDMNGLLQEREDIGREKFDPIFVQEECGYLPVIEPVFPEFDHFCGKFFLRASAEGRFPALAAEELVEKFKDLGTDSKIEGIIIEA